jgi:hypothetical protein
MSFGLKVPVAIRRCDGRVRIDIAVSLERRMGLFSFVPGKNAGA